MICAKVQISNPWRVLLILLFSLKVSAVEARIHALVLGVNEYQSLPPLAGAVNDANDIAASLDKLPDSVVSVLLNEQANHNAIKQQWFAMLERSSPGDTLVFSYAGHGSRVPESVVGSEADGLDDVFVLNGYANTRAGQREIIRDNQLYEWFSAAEGKGVQVLFVADSCHSGTMTRAADPRFQSLQSRLVDIDFEQGLEAELTVEIEPQVAKLDKQDLPYLTFLSAGLESQEIPEIFVKSVDGESDTRGALSFVFARALEGEADADGDLVLTRAELRHYILENVSLLSERQQTPELSPLAQPNQAVVALTRESIRPAVVGVRTQHHVYSYDLADSSKQKLAGAIVGLQWVQSVKNADFILHSQSGDLLSSAGDLVATGLLGSNVETLQKALSGALEKRVSMEMLKNAARRKLLRADLLPSSSSHTIGTRIEPFFSEQSGDFLIVLNVAGDGTVQLVYPLTKYGDPVRYGRRQWSMPLRVSEPLGEDHMIALVFQKAQPQLIKALEKLDGSRASLRVMTLLKPLLDKAEVEVGIVGMFSRP